LAYSPYTLAYFFFVISAVIDHPRSSVVYNFGQFVYEGHPVKVEVTEQKKVHNRYSWNGCMHETASGQRKNCCIIV